MGRRPNPIHQARDNIMTENRWRILMADDLVALTEDEIKDGWHFCCEWDGLLVGPGMKETEHCQCAE